MKTFLLILIMLMSGFCLVAQDKKSSYIINYDGSWQKKDNSEGIFYYPDTSDTLTLEQILASPQTFPFKKTRGSTPTYWADGHPYWFKFHLKNSTNLPQALLMELRLALYDESRFYVIDNNEILSKQLLTWQTPQWDRTIKHRNFIFPYTIDADKEVVCYIKLRKDFGSIWFPLTIWTKNAFDYYFAAFDYHGWGFVTGILLFVTFFSFLLLFAFKDLLYLYYGLYVFFALGLIFTSQGYYIRFYGDGSWGLEGNKVRYVATFLFLIASLLFVRQYLQWNLLKTFWLQKLSSIIIGVLALIIVFAYLDHLVFNDKIYNAYKTQVAFFISLGTWIPPTFEFYATIYCIWINHYRKEAIYFLLANLPISLIAFYTALSGYEIVPGNQFIEINYFAGAFLIKILLLTVILAYRLKIMQDFSENLLSEKAIVQQQRTEAVLEAEERERIRIARDLHDGIGQMLAAARMALSNFTSKKKVDDVELSNSLDLIEESIREIREVSHNMMPGSLTKFGLSSALKQFVNRINALDVLHIDLQIVGLKERLNEKVEMMLYRVIQEIISNIIRHAEATKVNIELIKHDTELVLLVEDNGKGFDSKRLEKEGVGLKNIATRVEYLNGNVNFDSTLGRGTSVVVEVPLGLN